MHWTSIEGLFGNFFLIFVFTLLFIGADGSMRFEHQSIKVYENEPITKIKILKTTETNEASVGILSTREGTAIENYDYYPIKNKKIQIKPHSDSVVFSLKIIENQLKEDLKEFDLVLTSTDSAVVYDKMTVQIMSMESSEETTEKEKDKPTLSTVTVANPTTVTVMPTSFYVRMTFMQTPTPTPLVTVITTTLMVTPTPVPVVQISTMQADPEMIATPTFIAMETKQQKKREISYTEPLDEKNEAVGDNKLETIKNTDTPSFTDIQMHQQDASQSKTVSHYSFSFWIILLALLAASILLYFISRAFMEQPNTVKNISVFVRNENEATTKNKMEEPKNNPTPPSSVPKNFITFTLPKNQKHFDIFDTKKGKVS